MLSIGARKSHGFQKSYSTPDVRKIRSWKSLTRNIIMTSALVLLRQSTIHSNGMVLSLINSWRHLYPLEKLQCKMYNSTNQLKPSSLILLLAGHGTCKLIHTSNPIQVWDDRILEALQCRHLVQRPLSRLEFRPTIHRSLTLDFSQFQYLRQKNLTNYRIKA